MMFKILQLIEDDLQQIFEKFYQKMLSNRDFAVFFADDAQIRSLTQRQCDFFKRSLVMEPKQLRKAYIRLGEMHYDLKLPFVDFSAAMTILEEGILVVIAKRSHNDPLIDAAFRHFRMVRGFTAKGYLNRMLDNDERDIELYLEHIRRTEEVDLHFATERIIWLKQLIGAIRNEDRHAAPAFPLPANLIEAIEGVVKQDGMLRQYIEDTLSRIEIDSANVFYFLEHKSYEEVLTLYRELMNIYKLCLMLANVITVATSGSVITTLAKDQLTGLLTRHSLESIVTREMAIAETSGYEISLVMVDVDHFKMVNDTHGHLAGDLVLRKVSQVLLGGIRSTDYGFRYGGEEFLLLLKGAPKRVCRKQAEAMRREVEKLEIEYEGKIIRVTASFGLATWEHPMAQPFSQMIREADEKLYRAKSEGRNRVVG